MNENEIHTTDLTNCRLHWRWTNPRYHQFSEADCKQISALDADSAQMVWDKSVVFATSARDFAPAQEHFHKIESLEIDDDDVVRDWLRICMPSDTIIMSWQPDTAILIRTELFINHWEKFCYPALDNISIWPLSEKWIVHYWNEEVFWYGVAR
ncbi:hypothetical protein JYT61_00555 [bacterium AH-315-E10]|nr:hypothetical protein [bacterium AH-315-E10]